MKSLVLWLLGLLLTAAASAQVGVVRTSAAEFAPARGESVIYTVRADSQGELTLEILSADGDTVRRLRRAISSAGEHALAWDGRDERGGVVPDEAWCARVVLEREGRRVVDDPCARSGGEVLPSLEPVLGAGGDISYTLPHAARVLIRVGVKNGAMLRSLSVWRPRPAGRNLQRWNGFDDSGVVDLRSEARRDRLAMLVTAFRLPDFSVISTGGEGLAYREWRLAQGWSEAAEPGSAAAAPLVRDGQRIARAHHMPRYKDREPRITLALVGRDGAPLAAGSALPREVRVLVDLHPDDRWLMQEQLYEVAFFVDGEFVSEEENGYVPIGWIWNTESLIEGRHLLTVNLTGFSGRVGTRTLALDKR